MDISATTAVNGSQVARPGLPRRLDPGAAPAPSHDGEPIPTASAQPRRNLLSDRDRKRLAELRRQDREVRAHEQAHMAAAGTFATGAPTFKYVTGPDGQQYAVAGEVHIDISEVPGDPQATARKMEQVRRAALAPMDPSPQDRQVAAEAAQKEAEAMATAQARSVDPRRASRSRPAPEQVAVRYRSLADADTSTPRVTLSA